MKKKLLLTEVLKIKADVEEKIERLFYDIVSYNTTTKKVDVLMERLEKLENFLIDLKLAIQTANLSKYKGFVNYFTIFKVSSLKGKLRLYQRLQKALKRAPISSAQIKSEEVTSKITALNEEILTLEARLTQFNSNKKVTINVDESLEYLL